MFTKKIASATEIKSLANSKGMSAGKRLTWEVIGGWEKDPPHSGQSFRAKPVEAAYIKHKLKLKQSNSSLASHILDTIFSKGTGACRFEHNKFPYNTPQGVMHGIIWLNPNYGHTEQQAAFKSVLSVLREAHGDQNVKIMSNRMDARSIPEIAHVHAFIKSG